MTTIAPESSPVRIGAVGFINTLPWIDGLEKLRDVSVHGHVPSRLVDELEQGRVDVALCSSIDYQRSATPLALLPVGGLGCDGPTLTVRLYSRAPIESVETVYADTDSHTSVALLQILLREQYGCVPEIVPYDAREGVAANRPIDWPGAMLLIGDKVVTDSPPAVRYPYQLDLGAAWRDLTGLPFVFAGWFVREATPPARARMVAGVLDRQLRKNRGRLAAIVNGRARERGWPADLAEDYLERRIRFAWTPAMRSGLEAFYDRAYTHGLIAERRPLVYAATS